jgi:hypothetical protein
MGRIFFAVIALSTTFSLGSLSAFWAVVLMKTRACRLILSH